MRDSTIVLQAEAATTTQVSGAGLAALARIVRMIDQRDTRLLLVPSSWSKGLDDVLRTRVRDAIRTLLLDPVRRQFEARLAEIEAQVEALGHEQGHSVLQQAASLLRELVALQHRNERFRARGRWYIAQPVADAARREYTSRFAGLDGYAGSAAR